MSKLKNYLVKILILLIVVTAAVVLYQTISSAWDVNSFNGGITVGMMFNRDDGTSFPNQYKLVNVTNNGLYCIQRGAHLSSYNVNTFSPTRYIVIEGNKATRADSGGNYTSTNDYNAIMSYIISGGSWTKGHGTATQIGSDGIANISYYPRQIAIYNYWNTWVQNAGLGLEGYVYGENPMADNETSKEIKEAAEDYATGANASYQPASVENMLGDITLNSNEIEDGKVGPFKFKFTGTPTITAYGENGNTLPIELYGSNKTTRIDQITSNENFYIKTTNGADISKVTVSVSAEQLRTQIWILESGSGKQRLIAVESSTSNNSASVDVNVNVTPVGDLSIIKQDADTSDKLVGMEFKLKTSNGTWVQQTSDGYNYDASFENATVFKINDNSGITIRNLNARLTYQVWETKTPNDDYVLSDQSGYDSSVNAVNLTGNDQWITLNKNATQTVTYSNAARYISISGYVWLDDVNKEDQYNSLWDSSNEENASELRVAGVTVILKNKNGTEVARTTTDSNGEYIFSKDNKYVRYNHTSEYYVEFDYSGIEITDSYGNKRVGLDYIPVAFNSETASNIVDNGSRALMDEVAEYDNDLDGVATTYAGTNPSLETTYGLSGNLFNALYNEETLTLEYINLGLKPIYDPQYEIKENLAYVKIVYNGYTYTYEYGAEELPDAIDDNTVPTVKFQDSTDIELYTRPFYPSAIYDAMENDASNLDVYVVYGITILNSTTYDVDEVYKEKQLNITSLTNTFDTTRYDLATDYTDDSNTTYESLANNDFGNWSNSTDNGNNTATTTYTGTIGGIGPGEYTTLFIQFSVKDNAIQEILQHPEGIFEENPTRVTAQGYHTYTRLDYSWSNNISREQTHYSVERIRTSSAPYLVFELGDDDDGGFVDRTIYGTVFEDGVVTTDGEQLGNGIFDSGENTVTGVKVELKNAENNEVATLYKAVTSTSEDGTLTADNYETNSAEMTTGDDGTFTFKGVTPGKYYIQLTYPNGDVYKSTIVTSEAAKNALGYYGTNEYGDEWYKHLEGTNYSVAVDDLGLREDVNETNESADMIASTATIDVTIENSVDNYTSETSTSEDGKEVYGVQYEDFEGFNLGIIKQPEQKVTLEKLITNARLFNTPTTIFDGNPETDKNMTGVSDLDGSTNGGSTYTRVEISEENIYGSELTLTYTINITNTSDVNYYETDEDHYGWYYMFGVTGDYSKEVQLNPSEIKDYLDPALDYVSSSSNVKVEEEEQEDGTMALVITELGPIERTEQKSFEIVAYKVLSTQDDDMGFNNTVEITSLINVTSSEDSDNDAALKSLKLVKTPRVPEPAEAYLTVSPPTGGDRISPIFYVITGIVMLVVLSAGVIIIKKKVL